MFLNISLTVWIFMKWISQKVYKIPVKWLDSLRSFLGFDNFQFLKTTVTFRNTSSRNTGAGLVPLHYSTFRPNSLVVTSIYIFILSSVLSLRWDCLRLGSLLILRSLCTFYHIYMCIMQALSLSFSEMFVGLWNVFWILIQYMFRYFLTSSYWLKKLKKLPKFL